MARSIASRKRPSYTRTQPPSHSPPPPLPATGPTPWWRRQWTIDARWLFAASLVLLTVSAWWTFDRTRETIDARQILIRDAAGKVRIRLAVDGDGPGLAILGVDEQPLAILGQSADGPRLFLYDSQRKLRAQLAIYRDGAGFALMDEGEKILFSAP